jgi:hypothetical protein
MEFDDEELKRYDALADKITLFMQEPADRLIGELRAAGLDQGEVSAGLLIAAFYAMRQVDEPFRRRNLLYDLHRIHQRLHYIAVAEDLAEGKGTGRKTRAKTPRKE